MKKLIAAIIISLSVGSCELVDRLFYDDVVAKVGKSVLYRSDVEKFIPDGISAEDSLNMVHSYIDSWATDQLLLSMAEKQLSKSKRDVSRELEDYRRSLLVYRYEKQYIHERIDTSVSDAECENYYRNNIQSFNTNVSLIQCVYVKISTDSPNYSIIRTLMLKNDAESQERLDKLCYVSAEKYTDYQGRWVPLTEIAQEIRMDLSQCEDELLRNKYIANVDNKMAYLVVPVQRVLKGGTAPYEYCADQIREIIISKRKQVLIKELEQNLLQDAYNNNKLVIYDNNEE